MQPLSRCFRPCAEAFLTAAVGRHACGLLLVLALATCPLAGQSDSTALEEAFDFWVGDWEVSWLAPDSTIATGSNRVVKILDGKVIEENFHDPGRKYKGRSHSVFNPRTRTWHQAWVDNNGGYIDLIGEIDGRDRIFKTRVPNPRGLMMRMVFTEITDDAFTWRWQGRQPEATAWQTFWEINYRRKAQED